MKFVRTFKSLKTVVKELERRIEEFERYYCRSSEEMLIEVIKGNVYEDSDICSWLCDYHVLNRLRDRGDSSIDK